MSTKPAQPDLQTDFENPLDQRSLVAFLLGKQTYALPIEPIAQIIEMVTITAIPQVDGAVEGVINVRGKAVPVVKMHRQLDLPDAPLELHTPIILVIRNGQMVGLIVDEVIDVLKVSASQHASAEDILPEGLGKAAVLEGLVHVGDDVVILLDLEHLFLSGQAQALARALDEADLNGSGSTKDAA